MLRPRNTCPECDRPTIGVAQRLRVELFGGYIVCGACGTHFHINHRGWWFAAALLGCEGMLLCALAAVIAVSTLGWWSLPLLVAGFLVLGTIVAAFSPLIPVEPTNPQQR